MTNIEFEVQLLKVELQSTVLGIETESSEVHRIFLVQVVSYGLLN